MSDFFQVVGFDPLIVSGGPAGPAGPTGNTGATGAAGPQGPPNPDASFLTAGDVGTARLLNVLNPTLASVVRSASGSLTSAVEGGMATSVTRDASGRIATISTGSTTRTITRDASGQITGVA